MLDVLNPLPADPAERHGCRKARFGSRSASPDQLAFDLGVHVEIDVAAEVRR